MSERADKMYAEHAETVAQTPELMKKFLEHEQRVAGIDVRTVRKHLNALVA